MTSFADIVAYIIGIINELVFVISGIAVVVFLWGMFRYIYQAASAKKPDRSIILWSLLTLFVMFSIWGIIRLMCSTLTDACNASSVNWNANNGLYQQSGPPAGGGIYPI